MTIALKQLRKLHCNPPHNKRAHCGTCRSNTLEAADWRERLTGVRDFKCPHGMDRPRWTRWLRLPKPGDTARFLVTMTLIGPAFKRVLKWTGSSCRCEKRRKEWNELGWRGCLVKAIRAISGKRN